MSTSEWLKKISFREGFFLSVVLIIITYYIFEFVQVPTLQNWWDNSSIAAVCFFALSLLLALGRQSKERVERMQILAGLSLTLMLIVSWGMLYYLFIADDPISGPEYVGMLIGSSVAYVFFLFMECFAFFQYEKIKAETTEGLVSSQTNIHNGNLFTYFGLGEEPYWNESLPTRNDYTEPCYVYADKFESVTPVKGHGRVIGYRISPTLVIHSMVSQDYNGIADLKSEISYFIKKYGGKMLEEEDIPVLRENWTVIDNMRIAIGDTPLPKYIIPFALPNHSVRTIHIFDGRVFTDAQWSSIIMKR